VNVRTVQRARQLERLLTYSSSLVSSPSVFTRLL